MDKDRIEGSVEQAKGKVKEGVGKVTGDSKTEAEGKAQQGAGKIQNAVGGLKDKALAVVAAVVAIAVAVLAWLGVEARGVKFAGTPQGAE